MTSQADTLKVAQLDVVTIGQKIGDARRDCVFGALAPKVQVQRAVQMMEQTARRLRKSFRLEEGG